MMESITAPRTDERHAQSHAHLDLVSLKLVVLDFLCHGFLVSSHKGVYRHVKEVAQKQQALDVREGVFPLSQLLTV